MFFEKKQEGAQVSMRLNFIINAISFSYNNLFYLLTLGVPGTVVEIWSRTR